MSTMNVSLPDDLKSFVEGQVETSGFSSTSEYVRELIRRDRHRQRLQEMLLDGANSPVTTPADNAYFASLRDRVGRSDVPAG